MHEKVKPIQWQEGVLVLLDQRFLPHRSLHVRCSTAEEVAGAIRSMVVRGAPAIGICAAFGMALAAQEASPLSASELRNRLYDAAAVLRAARPTAVNLAWAVDRMLAVLGRELADGASPPAISLRLRAEAEDIFREDLEANRRIGDFGAALLGSRSTLLTHCNAGALATAGYGTALGVVRSAIASGKTIAVYADETRPYLQGARLTAWELQQDGIDVTLITDGMAGYFFSRGTFDAVIVGADRIAANGDTANKIGTYTLAVLAQTHSVPFYVAAPSTTFDLTCPGGASIPIEERSQQEVTEVHGWDPEGNLRTVRLAPDGVPARHPAFDVTPASLITAFITDRGVLRPPFDESIRRTFEP